VCLSVFWVFMPTRLRSIPLCATRPISEMPRAGPRCAVADTVDSSRASTSRGSQLVRCVQMTMPMAQRTVTTSIMFGVFHDYQKMLVPLETAFDVSHVYSKACSVF
jgi:hypothetical protein